jgi:hypothetical protein
MTDIGTSVSSAYISDGQLIAWLEQKSDEQYTSVRELMGLSEQRSDLMKDLSDLKAAINDGEPAAELLTKISALRQKYEDSPYAAEVDALLLPMEAAYVRLLPAEDQKSAGEIVRGNILASNLSEEGKKALIIGLEVIFDDSDDHEGPVAELPPASTVNENFSSKLENEIDQLGRIDQLELIKLQELMSDARQTAQLGSNILSSRDQTGNAIVGNIRG